MVDEIGDINDAISYAAEILELDDYQAITYKKELDPFEIFIAEFLDNLDIDLGINKNLINNNIFGSLDLQTNFESKKI